MFPHGDARLDLTDPYAFPKPGDAGKSILIMNLHPSVGENPPGPTTVEPFAPEALCELKIDTDGDAVAGCASRPRMAGRRPRRCGALMARRPPEATTAGRLSSRGHRSRRGGRQGLRRPATTASSQDGAAIPSSSIGGACFKNIQFTGDDFFADKNVCSIVLEVPNSALGPKQVGLWHRTLVPADSVRGGWVQVGAALGPCNSSSSSLLPAGSRRPASPGSRRTMLVSSPTSRTR
jgi:hypothetical protein